MEMCFFLLCSELRAKLGLKPLEKDDDGESNQGVYSTIVD